MFVETQLKQYIAQSIEQIFGEKINEIALQPTKKEFEGTYTYVTFSLSKVLRKSPADIGEQIGEYLKNNLSTVVSQYNVVQGFLNISISDATWLTVFQEIANNLSVGTLPIKHQKVMVEYSSPNTNKPLHLGHLRNNFLGNAMVNILKADGYEVFSASIVNNRGVHICKSMLAYQLFGNGETPESSGIKGDHLVGKYYVSFDQALKTEIETLVAQGMPSDDAKKQAPLMQAVQQMLIDWENGDAKTIALWQKMNNWVYAGFDETYKKIGVSFDKTYYESDTYLLGKDIIEDGLARGIFFKKENGSVWIDLTSDGLDEKLVLRADGTSVYITQDLGLADIKNRDFPMNKSVYVVGNEQDYHFQVLFAIMKRLGRPYSDGLSHLSYGMVDLPSGKMKSREGTVVDADELIEEMRATAEAKTKELGKIDGFSESEAQHLYQLLGTGALKYFLLKVDPKKRMLFNPEESIDFQGNTAPYIQFNHARICAIVRKATQLGILPDGKTTITTLHRAEQELIYLLSQFFEKISTAAREFSPAVIAQYVYDIAKSYSQFYTELSIFNEPVPEIIRFRVQLSKIVAQTIQQGMTLLGIEVPERM